MANVASSLRDQFCAFRIQICSDITVRKMLRGCSVLIRSASFCSCVFTPAPAFGIKFSLKMLPVAIPSSRIFALLCRFLSRLIRLLRVLILLVRLLVRNQAGLLLIKISLREKALPDHLFQIFPHKFAALTDRICQFLYHAVRPVSEHAHIFSEALRKLQSFFPSDANPKRTGKQYTQNTDRHCQRDSRRRSDHAKDRKRQTEHAAAAVANPFHHRAADPPRRFYRHKGFALFLSMLRIVRPMCLLHVGSNTVGGFLPCLRRPGLVRTAVSILISRLTLCPAAAV